MPGAWLRTSSVVSTEMYVSRRGPSVSQITSPSILKAVLKVQGYCPCFRRRSPGPRKVRRFLGVTAPPWSDTGPTSLRGPNSFHDRADSWSLGSPREKSGTGLLVSGQEEGLTGCWRPAMTNGVHFLAGGISFGRSKGTSGSEADDEAQLTFYTEQDRSRRRSKGNGRPGGQGRSVGGGPGTPILC